jgi:2'-5' RNA ligase
MRLFIGIGLSPAVRRAVAEALLPFRSERPPVAWVAEENLHLTLKFLGEVPPGRVEEIGGLLATSAEGAGSFDLVVEKAGAFPPKGPPRVLWVGVGEPLELVGKLQQNIEDVLSAAGFPREGKRFHPHVTVGRVRGALPRGWRERYCESLAGATFGTVRADSFRLYESRLSPSGASYAVLRTVSLE